MKESKISVVHFIDPLSVIAQLKITPGSAVADFGCGAGYFSLPLSQAVGKEGIIYSLDVLPQALESVESKAKLSGIANIITQRVNLEDSNGSKLGSGSVDWVILKDVLFQNRNKEAIISEAHRILKPRGKILIVEWNDKNFSVGPGKKMRISSEALIELVRKHKFTVNKIVKAGNFHYALIIEKNK